MKSQPGTIHYHKGGGIETVQSLVRATEVLERLRKTDKSCSLIELPQMSGLPSNTVHRISQTFCSANYVSRDPKTHLYRLGAVLIPLEMVATRRLRLSDSTKPVLKDLMKITRENVFLIIISSYRGMVLGKIEGPNPLRVTEHFGSEVDLHCGGSRCALLALQSDNFVHGYIQEHLRDEPGFTPGEEKKLLNSLLRIHEGGVAISRREYIPDAVGIGASVFDVSGKAVASVGLIAPQSRTSRAQEEEFRVLVKQHATQLSTLLGFVQE